MTLSFALKPSKANLVIHLPGSQNPRSEVSPVQFSQPLSLYKSPLSLVTILQNHLLKTLKGNEKQWDQKQNNDLKNYTGGRIFNKRTRMTAAMSRAICCLQLSFKIPRTPARKVRRLRFLYIFLYQRPKEFVFSSHHLPRTTAHDEAVILWACVTKYLDLAKRNASCKDYAQQQQQIASNFRVPNEVLTSHSIILKGDRLWNVLNCRIPVLPYCCCVYATFDW